MDDLISVIIPVYNNEKYLSECLSSICSNTYRNIEIIVIDDGSTDNSGNISDEFAIEDSRVKVFHKKNTGVSRSRNLGMNIAKGEFIAFVDSDDYIDGDYFEKLLSTMKDSGCDLAVGSVAHVYGDDINYKQIENLEIDLINPNEKDKQNFLDINVNYYLYGPVNKLYKRSIITRKNIAFPEDTSYGEDLIFNFNYMKYCEKITYRQVPIYYYNHNNENSLSHKYREKLFENGLRLNDIIKNFALEKNILTEDLLRYIAGRVFDDAYNSLFDIWSNKCALTLIGKYKRTKMIMKHSSTRHAVKLNEYNNYSKLFLILIKRQHVLLFSILCFMAQKLK